MKYRFWVNINLYEGKYINSGIKETYSWKDLTFDVRNKWNWYFRYRAALLQVQHPKNLIEMTWGKVEITDQSPAEHQLIYLKRQRTSAKRMETMYKNAIKKYVENEKKKLFPDFENLKYKRAKNSLKNYQDQLNRIEDQIKILSQM